MLSEIYIPKGYIMTSFASLPRHQSNNSSKTIYVFTLKSYVFAATIKQPYYTLLLQLQRSMDINQSVEIIRTVISDRGQVDIRDRSVVVDLVG